MNLRRIVFIETAEEFTVLFKEVCASAKLTDSCIFLSALPPAAQFFREIEKEYLFSADNSIVIMNITSCCLGAAVTFLRAFKSDKILKRVPLIVIYAHQQGQDVTDIMLAGVNSFFEKPANTGQVQKLTADIIRYWSLDFVR